jgi:hypothetical protein
METSEVAEYLYQVVQSCFRRSNFKFVIQFSGNLFTYYTSYFLLSTLLSTACAVYVA